MSAAEHTTRPAAWWRRSVFWRVAALLVGSQLVVAALALGLSFWLTYDRSLDLAANSIRLRLDSVAEEIEQRAVLFDGLGDLPEALRFDLTRRFPDPVVLLSRDGRVLDVLSADSIRSDPVELRLPDGVREAHAAESLVVAVDRPLATSSWAYAPVYDSGDFLAGGLVVMPLEASVGAELTETREGYLRAFWLIAALAALMALGLGVLLTWPLVRPLRRITGQVEAIGAGDYGVRVTYRAENEVGRLAQAVNRMAGQVAHSVDSLRATDRLRRELIANIGHDLRTPLTAVLGYTEEAMRYLENGQTREAAEAAELAHRQSRHLQNLVRDLFELSVLDTVPPPLRREPIPLAELLTDAARSHRRAFEEGEIDFRLELPAALPIYDGDAVRLLRLIDNLLANARRHTPPGGSVRVKAEVDERQVRIVVVDTGEGMAPDVLEHVFERHFRGGDARTRRNEGTGLGLAISRAIARAHGGDLTAESEPGGGSVFELTLPLEGRRSEDYA